MPARRAGRTLPVRTLATTRAPSFGTRIRGDFIGGMAKVNGKFVILLNVAQVLALDGLAMLADSEAQAA